MVLNCIIMDETLYNILNWFIIYSFFGWVWETSYVSLKEGEYVNRGFITGPFCTIYGFGAVTVYLVLKPVQQNLLFLFVGGIILATILEYITAVLMETIFHTTWWDYSDKKLNFQGRICLEASLCWGAFSVILFRIFQPLVDDIVALYPIYVGRIGIYVFVIGYFVDFCFSASTAYHLRDHIAALEQELQKKQLEIMLRVNQRIDSFELPKGVSFEALKGKMDDIEILQTLDEKRRSMMLEFSTELKSYRNMLISKIGYSSARFFKAYPHLNRGYRLHHNKEHRLNNDKSNKEFKQQ